jgi:uncharacterized protein YbjT (DUF2867 family)
MRIAVAGGTGTLGTPTVDELRLRGHEVRALSRHAADYIVDLTTGAGLERALDGCEVVIDASNNSSPRGAAGTLVEGSRRLLSAGRAAGVGHHVCISIVGCDRTPLGYYGVKVSQEEVATASDVAWTIVRATQFHELIDFAFAAAARWRLLPVPRVPLQTVAAAEVARAVADVAERAPLGRRFEVAGPAVTDVRELARTWLTVMGRRVLRVPTPIPGKLGRALRAGTLTSSDPDVRGVETFEEWLKRSRDRPRA